MIKEQIILKTIFGSHLYGTDTPESDKDYKVIYMPSKQDILLNKNLYTSQWEQTKVGEGKNSKDDIDIEYIPLHQFIKLACNGDMLAIDLLHIPSGFEIETSTIWQQIHEQRKRFYTKDMKAFVGYARKQAAKYGIKGSRLDTCKKIMDILKSESGETRVRRVFDDIPEWEHTNKSINKNGIRELEVCNKKIQETQSCEYAYNIIRKYYEEYGKRAKDAADNKNIDWKAVSHALRAAYQILSIYHNRTVKFPLKEAEYLKRVKLGQLDYMSEVGPRLESLMGQMEGDSKLVPLPEKADKEYWELWLMETIENYYWGGL